MLALIDGDIILYRVGFTTELEEEWVAGVRVDEMIDTILVETKAAEFEVWLSDSTENGFRQPIYPQYKANRTAPRPRHYEYIKEYLITKWGARIALGMEADDVLGFSQRPAVFEIQPDGGWGYADTTVICSIDKDLLQIPGQHYNFVKKEWQWVEPWEGTKWFYKQILIGDTSDNIKGCSGIGAVKAGKAIDQIPQEAGEIGLFSAVHALYTKQEKDWSQEKILSHILTVGRVLKIKQQKDEPLWDFPKSNLTETQPLSSTPPTVVESTPSTEPTILATGSGSVLHGQSTDVTSKAVPQG